MRTGRARPLCTLRPAAPTGAQHLSRRPCDAGSLGAPPARGPGRAPGSPWRSPRTAGFAAGPVSTSAPCLTRGQHSTAWSPDTPTLGMRALRSRDRLTCAGHPTGLAQLGCLPWALSSVTGILGACCSRRPHLAPPAKQGPAFPTTEPPCDASSCPAAIPGTCSSGGSPPTPQPHRKWGGAEGGTGLLYPHPLSSALSPLLLTSAEIVCDKVTAQALEPLFRAKHLSFSAVTLQDAL